MEKQINIGDKAKCTVTGIEGIVVARHDYLYGVPRVAIQPSGSFEGKAHESIHMDILQAELVQAGAVSRKGTVADKEGIALGSKAKCKVTGFEGICVGKGEWLYACTKVLLQPQELLPKTGHPVEGIWFDQPGVNVLKAPKKELVQDEKKRTTGGPNKPTSDKSFKVSRN